MRHHLRAAAAAGVVLHLALAGCSGDGDTTTAPDPPSAESTVPSAPAPTLAAGEDAGSDLSSFVCEPGPEGDWTATGVLTSSVAAVASVEVTVVLGGPDAGDADGRRRLLSDLEPGVPTELVIPGIPASGDPDAACQVQVVRVDP